MNASQVDQLRAFNRYYTRLVGLLDEGLNDSDYTLTEARVLYELAQRPDLTASTLCRDLGLDPGYLSRIVKRFERSGLLSRSPSPEDGRQSFLVLSKEGQAVFRSLNAASNAAVAALLQGIEKDRCDDLLRAMETVRSVLSGPKPDAAEIALRPHRPGDIGWITHRQGLLYHQEYGWDGSYESLVADILGRFVREFDPAKERAWIAECEGGIVGSVFLVRQSDAVAKLRLLYVEPSQRGCRLGHRLVEECITFARANGYQTLTLWTNDILVAARRIYEAKGFRLVSQERHTSFGKDLVGQTWELELGAPRV